MRKARNAETTDLWDALEKSTEQPVRTLMDSWIFQPGYPLITVEKHGRGVRLTQQIFRYLQDGSISDQRWYVPIFLRAGSKSGIFRQTLLLTENEQTLDFEESPDWVVVNAGGHGFYRVGYSHQLLDALKGSLNDQLSSVEKFGLVNDTWAATLAGLAAPSDYLGLIELMREERDLNIWATIIGSWHNLERILDEDQCDRLAERVRTLVGPAVERFGWSTKEDESELESQLRGDLIAALGTLGEDRICQERAREFFARYEKAPDAVDRNIIPALVAIVAHTGMISDYENFYRRFKDAGTPQEETRFLFALANFRAPELIDRTLDLTINGEVRTQNAPYLVRGILLNRKARSKAWSFMKEHWEEMLRLYPDNSIPRMCEGIVGLVTPELEKDVREFCAAHPVKQGSKQLEQHLERLRVAVQCKKRWTDFLRN
jgi:puromycin-sensitive aminopeptidase